MRYLFVLLFMIIGGVVGGLAYREYTAGPPVVLAAPTQLQVTTAGVPLAPGGWTNSAALALSVRGGTQGTGADVEIRPVPESFTGTATTTVSDQGRVASTCVNCNALTGAVAHVHLDDGTYHWQARLYNGRGVSPWMRYRGSIHIDTHPPVVNSLTSPTDPVSTTVYHSSTMRFAWEVSDSGSGVQGYGYRLDHDPHGVPQTDIRTGLNSITLQGLDTGTWYFHLRAADRAGNWGQASTFPVRIDVTPPGLAAVHFNRFQLDPQYQPLRVAFSVNKAATTVRVGIYRQRDNALIRLYSLRDLPKGQSTLVAWDGKASNGSYVEAGAYAVYIRAVDAYGHASVAGWRDFLLNYQRIVVSLSQQKLWAYDGNSVFLTSLVTSGNKELPTPTGVFAIEGKFHPFTFHSPWPKSSPFYYAPSLTQYAMLFQAGGYFIHDAPWRTNFGPGSNQAVGTPGQNFTGTHGCINIPSDVAQRLFGWAHIGTIVQIDP